MCMWKGTNVGEGVYQQEHAFSQQDPEVTQGGLGQFCSGHAIALIPAEKSYAPPLVYACVCVCACVRGRGLTWRGSAQQELAEGGGVRSLVGRSCSHPRSRLAEWTWIVGGDLCPWFISGP